MAKVTIMKEIEILKQSLVKAPIIWKGDYPYFIHPISVASLLAEIKVDADTIITALLHDTVEDCGGIKSILFLELKQWDYH